MAAAQKSPDYAADDLDALVIGVLGGTGEEGRGLARRLAMAGSRVIIGSRDAGRAVTATRVVGAFHHVPAAALLDPEVADVDMDVLVLGDDRQATDLVQALASRIPGMRGVYAGRLRNCGQVEALTANLVSVNRRYKAHAGLRITDI